MASYVFRAVIGLFVVLLITEYSGAQASSTAEAITTEAPAPATSTAEPTEGPIAGGSTQDTGTTTQQPDSDSTTQDPDSPTAAGSTAVWSAMGMLLSFLLAILLNM